MSAILRKPYVIPFGTTVPQLFALVDKGVAVDGTQQDIDVEVATCDGGDLVLTTSVAWHDQAGGIVAVSGFDTLPVGTYRARYSLIDQITGRVQWVPNGVEADYWQVVSRVGAVVT